MKMSKLVVYTQSTDENEEDENESVRWNSNNECKQKVLTVRVWAEISNFGHFWWQFFRRDEEDESVSWK